MDPRLEGLRRALERLPAGSAFSGLTAAWLHGLDSEFAVRIEATAPADAGISTRAGMQIRRSRLDASDVVMARGFPATSMLRTLCDLCIQHSLIESVVFADTALHKRLVTIAALTGWVATSAHQHGIKRLRTVLRYVE